MTLISYAKNNTITEIIKEAAGKEPLTENELMVHIAKGHVVIPKNINHSFSPTAIGKGTYIKVNANIGISSLKSTLENEIKKLESTLALTRKPGWIIISIDSPLWLFSYYQWQKSNKLFEMASYTSRGGTTNKLINVTPHVISRYARILDEKGLL